MPTATERADSSSSLLFSLFIMPYILDCALGLVVPAQDS